MPQVYSQTSVPFSSPVTGRKSKEKKPRHFLDRGNADDSAPRRVVAVESSWL